MGFWLALMLGAAAPAMPATQHEITNAPVESLDERAQHIVDLFVAKRMADAAPLIDPLLEDYEKAYAGEKRRIYCAADRSESRLYMAEARAEKPAHPAVSIGAGWCVALWAKGYALSDTGQTAQAIPYLVRAAAMRPGDLQYWVELGFAYQATKNWPAMLDASSRAAALAAETGEPDRTAWLCRSWQGMGYALIQLGRWDDATAPLNKCLALDPDNVKAKNDMDYIGKARPKG